MSIEIRLQNFRSHTDLSVQIPDTTTIITGANGSGKTSIIEAIYVAYTGKSWRSNFPEIIKKSDKDDSQWWRVDLQDRKNQRIIKFLNDKKQFIIDDKSYGRLPQAARRPVILFEPNDMQLLYGSPSRRRQFIDRFIGQLEPEHTTNLNKFERVLKQRNNLLKIGQYSPDEMMIWNVQFASLSYEISRRRSQYLQNIGKTLSDKYFEISRDDRPLKIRFISGAPLDQDEILKSLLGSNDLTTPIGAQKDDFKFLFNRSDAKATASRGENRSIIFALLAATTEMARTLYGDDVLALLDDIDSELDKAHRISLYNMTVWRSNTIATTLEFTGGDKQTNIDLDNLG